MSSTLLLVTSAWLCGADPQPLHAVPASYCPNGNCGHHAVISHGGCDSCCDPCDDCGRPSLLDRLRGLFRKNDCCEPDPCHCAPAPCHDCHNSCDCADDCGRPSLLDRLRGLFRKDDCCEPDCCDHGCDCHGGHYHAAPAHPVAPVMPKAKPEVIPEKPKEKEDEKKKEGEGNGTGGGEGDGKKKEGEALLQPVPSALPTPLTTSPY